MAKLTDSKVYGNFEATGYGKVSGLLYAGTTPTLLTNASGTIKGAAIESSIAGTGLVYTNGVLSHATGNGYNHIPSDGTTNQILRWTSAGVAVWSNETVDEGGIDLEPTTNAFIVGTASEWTVATDNTARTALGLGTGNSPQFTGLTLTGTGSFNAATVTNLTTTNTLLTKSDATCGDGTGNITLTLNKSTSSNTYLNFQSGGVRRWQINVNPDATSAFILNECDMTTGNIISAAITITRTQGGAITLNRRTTVVGNLTLSGMFWDSTNDRLGIGTITPARKLHIVTSDAEAILLQNTKSIAWYTAGTGPAVASQIYMDSSNNLILKTGYGGKSLKILNGQANTTLVMFEDGGNVGIGTASAPTKKLEVNGAAKVDGDLILSKMGWDSTTNILSYDVYGITYTLSYSKVQLSASPSIWLQATNNTFATSDDGILSLGAKRKASSSGLQYLYLMGALCSADATNGQSVVGVHRPGTTEAGYMEPRFEIYAHAGNFKAWGGAIINGDSQDGTAGTTIIKTVSDPYMVYVDADNNRVGFGSAVPDEQIDQTGNFRTSGAGSSSVAGAATTVNITFDVAFEKAPKVVATPAWNTTCWVTDITTSGCVINFGTGAPGTYGSTVYYHAFRSHSD